jgi:hypothetical protein
MPILIDIEKKQIKLFSENPFYLNWNNKNEKHYLLKYILPNEDLEDINILKKILIILKIMILVKLYQNMISKII